MNFDISAAEKKHLRELAKRQREYANLPVMAERTRLWILHNRLQGERPMVVMEEGTFLGELLPPPQCESPAAAMIERQLAHSIAVHERIDDDKVIPDFFDVGLSIDVTWFGHTPKRTVASEGLGFHVTPLIEQIGRDFDKLGPSVFRFDAEHTDRFADAVNETIGDILPIRRKNHINHWCFGITQHMVNLMGMENMLCAMMDEPEEFHRLMRFITDELLRFLRWQQENGLLPLNNGNDYMGSGSYCFFDGPLGEPVCGPVRSVDLWGHLNSQESVGISARMYREMIFPYYAELAAQFGLLYYGCCEPVNAIWDDCLSHLPNLRKVSISPWCDEDFMAQRLAGSRTIYSRKPSPNFIGVHPALDADAFRAHIRKTADLTKGCKTEYIFRDIYTLSGNPGKVKEAVRITRELTQ